MHFVLIYSSFFKIAADKLFFATVSCRDFSVWGLCPLNGRAFSRLPLTKALNTPEDESGLCHAANRLTAAFYDCASCLEPAAAGNGPGHPLLPCGQFTLSAYAQREGENPDGFPLTLLFPSGNLTLFIQNHAYHRN